MVDVHARVANPSGVTKKVVEAETILKSVRMKTHHGKTPNYDALTVAHWLDDAISAIEVAKQACYDPKEV